MDCLRIAYVGSMWMQPFYLNLVEAGKAFVQVEQERDDLRAAMEQLSRKCVWLLEAKVFLICLCFVNCK